MIDADRRVVRDHLKLKNQRVYERVRQISVPANDLTIVVAQIHKFLLFS